MSTISGDPRRHQNCGNVGIALALVAVVLVVIWAFAEGRDRGRQEQWERLPIDPDSCYGLSTAECRIAREE